jgi:hypothetical protein
MRLSLRRLCLLLLLAFVSSASAWEWTDLLGNGDEVSFTTQTLSMQEVRDMRVRDIKRRLTRQHGYSADELGRILDKKELIQALSFEEHKEKQKEQEKLKRFLVIRGIVTATIAVVIVGGWSLWSHIYEVVCVNLVVYTDRKRHEASRCFELKSKMGFIGILLMAIMDILQLWLSASVLLSWMTSSKFFFPMPNLPVRPAQFMGGQVASGPMAKYGINIGPMAITWGFRFVASRLEAWTGRQLANAHRAQRKEAKQWESAEERAARKATRRAAKKEAREEAEKQVAAEEVERRRKAAADATDMLFPTEKVDKEDTPEHQRVTEESRKEFQEQMESFNMDELD